METIPQPTVLTCCKKVQHSARNWGKTNTSICGKPATHTNGTHNFCRHHSGTGRYIFRDGQVGLIVARFDTEKELRENAHLFPGMLMQKVTKSHRKDISPI